MNTSNSFKPIGAAASQSMLDALYGSDGNTFKQNIWTFECPKNGTNTIDFNDLQSMARRHPNWPLAHSIDWVLLTKQIWLSLNTATSWHSYSSQLSGLKLFWEAMALSELTEVTVDNCNSLLTFLLTHGWSDNKCRSILGIKSYGTFKDTLRLVSYQPALSPLGLNLISRKLTDSFIKKHLKVLIPQLTDDELTYRDWTTGGNYDYLTLDVGRFYTEHCLSFFEKHYPLALALKSTDRAASELASTIGIKPVNVKKLSTKILEGDSSEDLKSRFPNYSIVTLRKTHEAVSKYFLAAYKQASFEAALLNDETLQQFCIACDQQRNDENVDRFRITLWNWVRQENKKETQKILKEFQNPITWSKFQKQLSAVKKTWMDKTYSLPTVSEYESIGLSPGIPTASEGCLHRQLARLVAQAGLTVNVAFTGWRRSEFGYPRSAIERNINNDRLDEYSFPFRYHVNWYVPKTHGDIRLNREITQGIFILAERLQKLHATTDEEPCLYSCRGQRKNQFDSTDTVKRYIPALWENFVNHYPNFKLLDKQKTYFALQKKLDTGVSLKEREQDNYNDLLAQRSNEEWLDLTFDINLKDAWQRTRDELPRVLLANFRSTDRDKWLVKYVNKTLTLKLQTLLDKHLSNNVKEWLSTLTERELDTRSTSSEVSNHLLEGTLYPTPHAFRHMWAESVYRRFDGDIGWMIRSQFQHISRSQWHAYIRDKDNRRTHDSVKTKVISSLVRNYLTKKGKGYAGQLNTWLRRIIKQTTLATPEEQEQFVEHISFVEIEDIKANPWGYCLLKYRTRSTAKCAVAGEPMRHNASPELCTGCPHNLMQTGNVEWSIFHAAPHVEALNNPITPDIFKISSYKLVKQVTKHVRTLDPLHEALPELEAAIDDYNNSRAA